MPRLAPIPGPLLTPPPAAVLTAQIGNTPLLDLSHLVKQPNVRLLAKAEFCNPGGSVKDRPALAMVRAAIADGSLTPERRVLDATSGNTGIAYAMLGSACGFGVTLCLARNVSEERKRILTAYGAELVLTDPLAGSDGAIERARELAAAEPERFVYLDQYSNPENWGAHYRTTGPEIWAQTEGRISHFVAGLGTTGTFIGVGRYLKEQAPSIVLVSLEPDGPLHGLEGMKHMETAIVPKIYDPQLADEALGISTERAYQQLKWLGLEAGLLLGVSAAANVATAIDVAERLEQGTVVTILCDDASKYLSENFWEQS